MVLDTYDQSRDVLIFKNTYDNSENGQPKQVEIERTHRNAPKELYFVHIEVKDMDNPPPQKIRKLNWSVKKYLKTSEN